MDVSSEHQPVAVPQGREPLPSPRHGRTDGRPWLARTDLGATAVEYALLVAFVAAVIIGTVATLGLTAADTFVVPCLNGPTCP